MVRPLKWRPAASAAAAACSDRGSHVRGAAEDTAVSPPYREYVEPAPACVAERARSPAAASRSSRSSRTSSQLAALTGSRVRELVALRVHSDAARVLAEHGVDGDALSFLPADELLALVVEAGVVMSSVSVALFRRAVTDAAAKVTVAARAVVDLTGDDARAVPAAEERGAAASGAPVGVAAASGAQFARDDAVAAAQFSGGRAEPRTAEQVEQSRQAAWARRARNDALRALIAQVAGEAVELFAAVPSTELPELMASLAQMLGIKLSAAAADDGDDTSGGVRAEILTTRVCFDVNALLQRAHTTAQRALAPHASVSGAHNRVVLAVAGLASTSSEVGGGSNSSSKHYGDSANSVVDGAVRTAATNLASDMAAREALEAAHRIVEVDADGNRDGERPRLRAAMRDLETGQFADDVYTLLHQEKLSENPSGQWTQGARAVLSTVRELRSNLMAARERMFARVAPDGVSVAALVAAVNSGKLSVDTLVPKGVTQPTQKAAALQRVWPLLTAVAAEVLPRDSGDRGTTHMLLLLAVNAFDYGKSNPEGSVAIVETVLAEWEQRWKRVREGVQKHEHARALAAYEWTRAELAAKQGMKAAVTAAAPAAPATTESSKGASARRTRAPGAAEKSGDAKPATAPAASPKRADSRDAGVKAGAPVPAAQVEKRGPQPPSA